MNNALQKILDDAEGAYQGPAAVDRLNQLRSAIATAQMALEYLGDEAERMPKYKERAPELWADSKRQ